MNMKMVFSNQKQSERRMDVTDDEIEDLFLIYQSVDTQKRGT